MTNAAIPARTTSIAQRASIGRVVIAGLLLTTTLSWGEESARPTGTASILPDLKGMPSFNQRDIGFKDGGLRYCGPTAAANGLMWLASQGYPNLKPAEMDDHLAQREMIKQLATLMGVHRDGSTSSGFMCGVKSYVKSMGYSAQTAHISGQMTSGGTQIPPDLTLLSESARSSTVVWLGLGIYRLEQSGKIRRTSGHLVTLAGITSFTPSSEKAAKLLISDPEHPGGHVPVQLEKLENNLRFAGKTNTASGAFHTLTGIANDSGRQKTTYRILESIQTLSLAPNL